MSVLLAWGILSLVAGVLFARKAGGVRARSFWQVCAVWGIVDVVISASGFLGNAAGSPDSLAAAVAEASRTQALVSGFFVSDLATMLVGLLLNVRVVALPSERLQGWGRGLLLQGLFFALFDAVLLSTNGAYLRNLLAFVG